MTPIREEDPGFAPGTILGERFRIVRAVGSGGMGTVYEAVDLRLDRRVALKCARPGHRYRLPPEARAAREVSHFNVCKVHELHTLSTPLGEVDCLSMEFIEGANMAQRIEQAGPLAGKAALDVARQICAGLAQAHRQGVVHGDLKCPNVILGRSPEGRMRAVITDFGLARIAGEIRGDTVAGGTAPYMAPECFLGEPPAVPSDLYALGILLHVMLTGHAPRRVRPLPQRPAPWMPGSDQATRSALRGLVVADWQREVEPLPSPWRRIVTHCIAELPEKRPRSVAAVMNWLDPRRRVLKVVAAVLSAALLIAGGREWRSAVPPTPVRLVVLPFGIAGDRSDVIAAIGLDVTERLAGARSRFTVIAPAEAQRNLAATPQAARQSLGATHALDTHVQITGGVINATAVLVDLESGRTVGRLQGSYPERDSQILAQALVGTVTEAFRLPAASPRDSVSAAAYPYYVQGLDLLRRDPSQADPAIPLFTRAIELDGRSALPYAGLAEAEIQRLERGDSAQLSAAEAAAAKAASINPDSVPVLLASGFVEQESGHYEKAIQLLTRATEIAPSNPEPWRRLAFCYDRASRPDDAFLACQHAIQAKPDYYRPYLTLGTFYFNRGQFARAEEQYRRALAAAPDLQSGHMNLGLALMQRQRFSEAEAELLEALRRQRSPNLLLNIGSLYYAQERFEQAADYYQQSLAAGGHSSMLYRDLGDADRHLGKIAEAQVAYRRASELAGNDIQRDPRRAVSHAMLGLLNAFLGDRAHARFEISQALAIDSENRSVVRDAAIGYECLGLRTEALASLHSAPRSLLEEINRQPDLKSLAKDSRFQDLLANTPAR